MATISGLHSLKLLDYSDRELLIIVMELGDQTEDGYTTSLAIADQLGITGQSRLQSVGSRMAALRRFGAVEKDPNSRDRARWQVSPIGRAMALGEITNELKDELSGMPPDQLIVLTRILTQKARRAGDTARHLVRREWTYGTAKR